jgi:hypothetical protein
MIVFIHGYLKIILMHICLFVSKIQELIHEFVHVRNNNYSEILSVQFNNSLQHGLYH